MNQEVAMSPISERSFFLAFIGYPKINAWTPTSDRDGTRNEKLYTEPGVEHYKLVSFQELFPKKVAFVSLDPFDRRLQNAGASQIYQPYGNSEKVHCTACKAIYSKKNAIATCTQCQREDTLKPFIIKPREQPIFEPADRDLSIIELFQLATHCLYIDWKYYYGSLKWLPDIGRNKENFWFDQRPPDNTSLYSELHIGYPSIEVPRFIDRVLAELQRTKEQQKREMAMQTTKI